jgi:hypothetical protein
MNYLRVVLAISVLSMVWLGSAGGAGTDAEIVTTGSGSATAKADILILDVTLQSQQKQAKEAMNTIAQQHSALLAALSELGIAKDDLWTGRFGVEPDWHVEEKGGSRKLIGWVGTHVVTIRVRDISNAGRVVDAAIGVGAMYVGALKYYVEHPDEVWDRALAEAVREARGRAETMAGAAGGHLGELIDLSTEPIQPRGGELQKQVYSVTSSDVRSPAGEGLILSARELTMTVTVWGRWRFMGGQ